MNNVPSTLFSSFVELCKKLESTSSRKQLISHIGNFFLTLFKEDIDIFCYLLQGELNAPYKNKTLQISDSFLATLISRIFEIKIEEVNNTFKLIGDWGDTSYHYKKESCFIQNTTLKEVYTALIYTSEITGVGAIEKKQSFLSSFLKNLDAGSMKYIFRFLKGSMRLRVNDMTILHGFAHAYRYTKEETKLLENAYYIQSDLGNICKNIALYGSTTLKKLQVPSVGIPVQSAAAERMLSAQDILEKLNGKCIAQPKLDGMRIQVHINTQTNTVTLFSRNQIPFEPGMIPEVESTICTLLKNSDIHTCILDAEMIGFENGNYLPFQKTIKRRRKHNILDESTKVPIHLVIFDCLFLNNQSLLSTPCKKRFDIISKIKWNKNIYPITSYEFSKQSDLEQYFNECTEQGFEGLVCKDLYAPYQPGKRGYAWIKWKRMMHSKLSDSIDVVVLGYYYGKGKRTSGIGALLIGITDEHNESFYTLAKVGTGLDEQTWAHIKSICDTHATPKKPLNVICNKKLYPDVWCIPSLVVTVEADELSHSNVHSAYIPEKEKKHIALRFPRLTQVRYDKKITDIANCSDFMPLKTINLLPLKA